MMTNESEKLMRHLATVRFYTSCFCFRQPSKVVCDGTFFTPLLCESTFFTPVDIVLTNILGAKLKVLATR